MRLFHFGPEYLDMPDPVPEDIDEGAPPAGGE